MAILAAGALGLAGCNQGSKVPVPGGSDKLAAEESFTEWPDDNIARSDSAGVVEREGETIDGRRCFFSVPDWADPTGVFAFRGQVGSTLWFSLTKRDPDLKAQDEATIQDLLKGGNKPNQTLVIARPWRGWYGESTVGGKRLRIYILFHGNDALEVHTEWPKESEKALAEAEELASNVIYSAQPLTPSR